MCVCVCVCWFKGSARLGPVHLHGMLAAFIKWGIEWVKVAQVSPSLSLSLSLARAGVSPHSMPHHTLLTSDPTLLRP